MMSSHVIKCTRLSSHIFDELVRRSFNSNGGKTGNEATMLKMLTNTS